MPIYEYRCGKCNRLVEETRRIAERNDLKPCPREGCRGKLQLQMSAPQERFPGASSWRGGGR